MKIALLGYGKMGQIIEQFALQRDHEIVLKIGTSNCKERTIDNLKKADIAIDFSTPSVVMDNIEACFAANVPIVVGTTGWYNQLVAVKNECEINNHTLLYGANFSVGVNLFFYINKMLARLMNNYPQYEAQIDEIHHTSKIDSPSGTAITIAEGLLTQLARKKEWVNNLVDSGHETIPKPDQLLIESYRIEDVPGTHTVVYSSEVDDIEIKHTAHNRKGFALGAILAAEWLQGKTGFYSVEDLFNFKDQ